MYVKDRRDPAGHDPGKEADDADHETLQRRHPQVRLHVLRAGLEVMIELLKEPHEIERAP
jgi:hypothetical protein